MDYKKASDNVNYVVNIAGKIGLIGGVIEMIL